MRILYKKDIARESTTIIDKTKDLEKHIKKLREIITKYEEALNLVSKYLTIEQLDELNEFLESEYNDSTV